MNDSFMSGQLGCVARPGGGGQSWQGLYDGVRPGVQEECEAVSLQVGRSLHLVPGRQYPAMRESLQSLPGQGYEGAGPPLHLQPLGAVRQLQLSRECPAVDLLGERKSSIFKRFFDTFSSPG